MTLFKIPHKWVEFSGYVSQRDTAYYTVWNNILGGKKKIDSFCRSCNETCQVCSLLEVKFNSFIIPYHLWPSDFQQHLWNLSIILLIKPKSFRWHSKCKIESPLLSSIRPTLFYSRSSQQAVLKPTSSLIAKWGNLALYRLVFWHPVQASMTTNLPS